MIPKEYDFEPTTIGDHLRKRRLALRLYQKDVASILKVDPNTILNWEKGYSHPPVEYYPSIYSFLGYMPDDSKKDTIPVLLIRYRRTMGWNLASAASALGVDPSTWSRWEKEGVIQQLAHRHLIAKILNISEKKLFDTMKKRWKGKHAK